QREAKGAVARSHERLELSVQVVLFEVRQRVVQPAAAVLGAVVRRRREAGAIDVVVSRVREIAERVVVVVQSQRHPFEVGGALDARGSLAGFLDGRQQQADQDGDDGYYHQQLDQREAAAAQREAHVWTPVVGRTTAQNGPAGFPGQVSWEKEF